MAGDKLNLNLEAVVKEQGLQQINCPELKIRKLKFKVAEVYIAL